MAKTIDDDCGRRHWAVRIVLEAAEPLLKSQEIRQALDQVQATAETLRDLLADSAGDLLCSASISEASFVETVDWDKMRRWLPLPEARPMSDLRELPRNPLRDHSLVVPVVAVLAAVAGAGACLVIFVGWVALVAALELAPLAGVLAVTRLAPRTRLEPFSITRDDLRRRVIGPYVRGQINRMLGEHEHSVHLCLTTAPGLAELVDREQIVATDAFTRLGQLSAVMSSGNIGVSGPRGAGKTTLLQQLCDVSLRWTADSRGSPGPDLQVMVSAPVDYDAREFILHLFGQLCERILATARARSSEHTTRDRRPIVAPWLRSRREEATDKGILQPKRAFLILSALILVAGAATVIAWGLRDHPRHLPSLTPLGACLAIGAVFLVIGASLLLAARVAGGPSHRRLRPGAPGTVDDARMWLDRIRFLQATTTGYSGALRLPAGTQLEATATRQLTEQQLTLPELVDKYREFTAHAALWWRQPEFTRWPLPETNGRIVIGIDEVDKIRSAESVERFLNDIKAIFGIPHCLYVVSVSDDALAAFEQRAFVARTVFDSAFDEVIYVSYLGFEAARDLLRSRVASLPDPMIAFCQVISGGLPRDLIRATRALIEACEDGHTHITDLAHTVIASEVAMLKRTCLAALSKDESRLRQSGLLPHLLDDTWPGEPSKAMLTAIEHDLSRQSAPPNFSAALYFYATTAEVFGPGLDVTIASLRSRQHVGLASIDRLAHARSLLSGNPDIAWEFITRFRAARDLAAPARPWLASAA